MGTFHRHAGDSELSAHDEEISLSLPPKPLSSHRARRTISTLIERRIAHREHLVEFMTAVGEALANAVEHSKCDGTIGITASVDGTVVTVEIVDNGIGIPQEKLVDLHLPDSNSERGRGLSIMTHCADTVDIESSPEHGTRIVLSRDFAAPDPDEAIDRKSA